jgi:hypothetical protein
MRSGSARKGSGLLPPNPKQWDNENHALDLREFLNAPLGIALDVFGAFAQLEDVLVFAHGDLPMAAAHVEHMRAGGKSRWSGMAIPLQNTGGTAVIYNDSHPITRIRATLMEEFFHLWLKHPPSRVRVYDAQGRLRTHDGTIESEAYGCGAAALVPYSSLKIMIDAGKSTREIAQLFQVSRALVEFRAKVTKQYAKLKKW